MAKTGPKNAQGEQELQDRRKRVTELYLSGHPQAMIAKQLGVHQTTVWADLKAIREEWLERIVLNYNEKMCEEIAKIDNLERVAWEAWEESKRDAETQSTEEERQLRSVTGEEGEDGSTPYPSQRNARERGRAPKRPPELTVTAVKHKLVKKGRREGSAVFLDKIQWCIETRARLLGLLKDETKAGQTTNNFIQINWDDFLGAPADPVEAKILSVSGPKGD